uniref:S1 motif domain-containing protein n=1 Tax=Heterosigma akashiwo TaxID=2829 RepID=A0A7S3UYU4_HETAK
MVELSLKPSDVISDGSTLKLEDLKEGLKVKGTVKKVKNYGVFVTIKGSNLTGLCHISEASDDFVENLESSFEEGDYVKAIVLKVEGKRISLGMKPSYFENDESSSSEEDGSGEESGEEGDDSDKEDKGVRPMDEDSSDEEDEVEALLNQARLKSMKSPKKKDSKEGSGDSEAEDDDDQDDSDSEDNGSEDEPAGRDKRKITKPAEESSDEEDEEEEEEEEDIAGAEAKDNKDDDDDDSDDSDDSDDEKVSSKLFGAKKPSLDIGFKWDDGESTGAKGGEGSSDEDSSDDDEEEGGGGKHSHKARQKAAERRREERALRAREAALADGEGRAAETDADHERLLVAEPNNALRWVQYMAFKLAAADADGARALAERALKTIAFRKEEERMNIWVALLNLEHKFGTPETLEQAFARAVQFNHPKRVHLRMAEIYGKSGAKEECEQLFQKAMKKFRSSKQVWMAYQEFRLRAGDGAGARALLPRALQSLAQHKHVPVVARFAHLEYDHGSAERGRTILEGLVGSYPKRLDLWNQYVDREIKQGNLPEARAVFERMISLSLSPHKMKNVFKKYLRFEMEHGDEEKAEEVKAKAQEYVRSLA